MLAVVENVRRKQLAWVNAVLAETGWKPARLAKEAGIDHSTLGKFLRDPLNVTKLSAYTVEKISAVSSIPPYHNVRVDPPRGLADTEAEPFDEVPTSELWKAVDALKAGRNDVNPWVLRSRALENAGYLPGDVLMVDINATPEMGDVVCAQVYDRAGRVETVMRLFEYPFLVAASLDRKLMRPLLVDNDRVVVRGVAIASMRPRRAA